METIQSLLTEIANTSLLEWLAVICSIAYVILVAKRVIWCWLFAMISSGLYIYLCYTGLLYFESILNGFYLVMAIVGWITWKQFKKESTIQKWPVSWHVINIIGSLTIAVLLGYLFDQYTNQANPYVDAFTTCFSLVATFMVARRILENWIYWIVIDAVSVYLYADRGFVLSAFLFGAYTILAVVGYMSWLKSYRLELE